MPERAPVTVIVPCKDEELNLHLCLESVSHWADQLVVVDSGSTDATVEIARGFTDEIYNHPYEGAPQQWAWILENVPITNQWLLALDADQTVSVDLQRALSRELVSPGSLEGIYVGHRQMFRGRFIRWGGIYPRWRLAVFRRDKVRTDELDLMDQRFYVDGPTKRVPHDIIEENLKERALEFWMHKQVTFGVRAATEEVSRAATQQRLGWSALFKERNDRVLFLKQRWARLPLYWRSVGYFLYRYILRLGFLDGRAGFLYHLSQALLFRVILDAKVEELRAGAQHFDDTEVS